MLSTFCAGVRHALSWRILTLVCCFVVLTGLVPASALAAPTFSDMVGAMIMVGFRGTEPTPELLELVRSGRIGGVILFDRDVSKPGTTRNIVNKKQVARLTKALQSAAPRVLLIAVDQEGGKVRRLKPEHGFTDLPSAWEMGQEAPEKTRQRAFTMGQELAAVGINMVLAPCVDVNINPDSPAIGRFERSFSADPEQVIAHAQAFSDGLRAAGIIPVLKHFPGHGSAQTDSHMKLADISNTWRKDKELAPYKTLFERGFSGAVLVGHLFQVQLDPRYPASLSKPVLTDLLRGELGWQGVVLSDDLEMEGVGTSPEDAITRAVIAGMDILIFGNNINYIEPKKRVDTIHHSLESIRSRGLIDNARLMESWNRIETMKRKNQH
ncbi:MAG: beta-N-acetylhexosaminidase [Bilophila sp.]